MRSLLLIACIALLTSCSKESIQNDNLLTSVTVNNAVNESFEYNADGKLVKENFHNICDHPSDEFTYTYSTLGIQKVESVIRSLYSSTAAICDKASGIHSVQSYEYDDQQRIKKIIRENSITTYTYNNAGLVERAEHAGAVSVYSTYKYDSRKNLVEEYSSNGLETTRYEFDNNRNPYYEIKSRPDVITAFNTSPNNVVKIINGSQSHTIQYEYNAAGYPVKMIDGIADTYLYNYR